MTSISTIWPYILIYKGLFGSVMYLDCALIQSACFIKHSSSVLVLEVVHTFPFFPGVNAATSPWLNNTSGKIATFFPAECSSYLRCQKTVWNYESTHGCHRLHIIVLPSMETWSCHSSLKIKNQTNGNGSDFNKIGITSVSWLRIHRMAENQRLIVGAVCVHKKWRMH